MLGDTGTTYPDLELLPMIAGIFETTVDALLGCTEEEKQQYCDELYNKLEEAAKDKEVDGVVTALREIRRNLREYQSYWFWGLFWEIWKPRLHLNEKVLDELRFLSEEIFACCPGEEHYDVIRCMSYMEDDEHIEAFLDTNAVKEGLTRTELLFERYKMREELDKIEPVRQLHLWHELDGIFGAANDWQVYLCQDAAHWKWYCETQLNYLNAVNCLHPDPSHIISGGDTVDLWCTARVILGMRYTVSLAKLGDLDLAFAVFDDMISLFERIMAIPNEDEFDMTCNSPALKGFALKSKFHWLIDKDGREYRQLCMHSNDGWENWIIPIHYLESTTDDWFTPLRNDPRWDSCIKRLQACVITREKQN